MPELRTDAQLVAAYLSGDRGALAGMYDRFGAGLYDTAAAMLRDRHEAADATQDVFLIAAQRLQQLRDPERLKPWLFAILRNEVFKRSKRRGRTLPTDFSAMGAPEMAAPTAPDAEGEMVAAGEMADLVRSAACGLDERDQLVLELSVRQGLQGAELAAALGVTPEQSYTLVHRMRERVERSLGAVVVARAGRKDCPALADILRGWDGEFTVLIRKRVARHIEQCETCEHTRRKAAPLALFGAAPAFAAPPFLRDRIMGSLGSGPTPTYRFDGDGGFPRVLRRFRYPAILTVIVAALVIGVGTGAILASTLDEGPVDPADETVVVTEPPETVVITLDPTTSTTAQPTTTAPETTPPSTTAPAAPGLMVVTTGLVDLGANTTSAPVSIRNDGGLPFTWQATGSATPFALVGNGGTVQPGETQVLTVSLNRANLAEGNYERVITIDDGAGHTTDVTLRARVERPPVLDVDGPTGVYYACQWSPNPKVYVLFTDETGVSAPLTLQWTGQQSGQVTLLTSQPGVADGPLAVRRPDVGDYEYTITAVDVRGNTATVTLTFRIDPCPG